MLLEMAASAHPERTALTEGDRHVSYAELLRQAVAGAAVFDASSVANVVFLAENGEAFATALFAAAWSGKPFSPLNYRLGAEQLHEQLAELRPALVIADDEASHLLQGCDVLRLTRAEWLAAVAERVGDPSRAWHDDGDGVAVLLSTSGTTSKPKAAILRHRHIVSYVLGTVELGAAKDGESSLVSVPPYHIAGVSNTVTNVYGGRRIVYLPTFSPEAWLTTVRRERVTHCLVVPTMLARVVEALRGDIAADVPSLQAIAYGGARLPQSVLERALRLFPGVGFVNAYGLTETSSTIAVLGPEDHRAAASSSDAHVRAGWPLPGARSAA